MSNLEIKDIFEKERFPKSNWQFISVLLYAPFGIILAILRFSIGVQAWLAGILLARTPAFRSIVLRILCFVLGVNVEEDNKGDRSSASKVIVGNCATKIDYIPMYLVTGSVCPSGKKRLFSDLMPGLKDFEGNSTASMKSFVEKGLAPLFLQPEGATSGKNCLLKFTEMPGDLCKEVQPVAIVVERPSWANTAPTVLGASLPSDIFWFLFTPSTLFKVKYLNVIHRDDDESDENFIGRIESAIADSLSYQTTSFTSRDKMEYEKRYLADLTREVSHPVLVHQPPPSTELLHMTAQVVEVLPHVPRDVILRDLGRTHSVDLTISNILEGVVQFVPVEPVRPAPTPTPSTSSAAMPKGSKEAVFSSSSHDRMMSFAERKAKMIAEARQRYIEKNGLVLDEC